MENILTAIKSIIDFTNLDIENITDGNNRMNNMGEGLEAYIKNAFADTFTLESENKKVENNIKGSISLLRDLEVNKTTNELRGIKNVDPLNITYLSVRGMWVIKNPNNPANLIEAVLITYKAL